MKKAIAMFQSGYSFIHLLNSVRWSHENNNNKKRTVPLLVQVWESLKWLHFFPFISLTNFFSLGIGETPDFLLHTSSSLLLKHGAACKIHILANACYVLICPN